MLRKPLLSLLLAIALLVGLVASVAQLFLLRYSAGDVYPIYSSLRPDPLGAEALYAALQELPGHELQRNFRPLPKLQPTGPITLFYAGVSHRAFWSQDELAAFDRLVVGGSRAIFTFLPVERASAEKQDQQEKAAEQRKKERAAEREKRALNASPEPQKKGKGKATPAPKAKPGKPDEDQDEDDETAAPPTPFAAVAKRWGFSFGYLPGDKKLSQQQRALLAQPGAALEKDLPWHGALCFRDLGPHWKVLYTCDKEPVIIERTYGGGTIVLTADSYCISNEAMRADRRPKLLAELFSGPPHIVFDEEHHGVRESPGIVALARKYRLHGAVAGLALVAALFVWQNAVRFVPPEKPLEDGEGAVMGKEAGQGLTNLLRRSIPERELLQVAAAEWRHAFGRREGLAARFEEALAAELSKTKADPAAASRAITRALKAR